MPESSESPFPFDIITLIVDIIGENDDKDLLRDLSLVSHSFNQICLKYLFASIHIDDGDSSSKVAFVNLLDRIPDAAKHIHKLTYSCNRTYRLSPSSWNYANNLLLLESIQHLPELLRTLSRLNSLKITSTSEEFYWDDIDSSISSSFLYLMHLPSINHIDLSSIQEFPLSNFTTSPNLHRLDISFMKLFDYEPNPEEPEEFSPSEIIIQSSRSPSIHEFHSFFSTLFTTKLLYAIRHDGQAAFDFTNLRVLYICLSDEWNVRHLLQLTTSLEELHLSHGPAQCLLTIHDIFSTSAVALKVLSFTVSSGLYGNHLNERLIGLCEGLEAMLVGNNVLETLSFEFHVDKQETEDSIGPELQSIENVLVKPGWFALRKVSFKITFIQYETGPSLRLHKALSQTIPHKYLSQLSKLESVAFDYSFILSEY